MSNLSREETLLLVASAYLHELEALRAENARLRQTLERLLLDVETASLTEQAS